MRIPLVTVCGDLTRGGGDVDTTSGIGEAELGLLQWDRY